MADVNGAVAVPKWQVGLVTGALLLVLGAMVADRVAVGADVQDIRERVVRLETMHGLPATTPDGEG